MQLSLQPTQQLFEVLFSWESIPRITDYINHIFKHKEVNISASTSIIDIAIKQTEIQKLIEKKFRYCYSIRIFSLVYTLRRLLIIYGHAHADD